MSQLGRRRYYDDDVLVPFEEDSSHEFKGHRNLGADEVPPWCYIPGTNRRSRKPVSRALCAFLNAGTKGTVYLGIVDQGICKGICLTKHQQNHLLVAMKDLMKRFKPPVADHLYSVEFVPVGTTLAEVSTTENIGKDDLAEHLRSHLLRTSEFCWCDIQAAEAVDEGKHVPKYVVEITMNPPSAGFDIADDGDYRLVLPPVYVNEEGLCFFRENASCVQYSMQEIYNATVKQIDDAYKPIIDKLSKELSNLSVPRKLLPSGDRPHATLENVDGNKKSESQPV